MDSPLLIISSDSEEKIDTKSNIKTPKSGIVGTPLSVRRKDSLTPLKRRFEASSSHSAKEEDDTTDEDEEFYITDGDEEEHDSADYDEEYGLYGRAGADEEHSGSDDDSKIDVKAEVLKDSAPPEEEWVTVVGSFHHVLYVLFDGNAFGVSNILLLCCESDFFLLGATGDVYNVRLSTTSLCSCPDRQIPCKHILFVFLRVLEVSLNDPCVWRKTLRECQLTRLLNIPTSSQILAGSRVRERFLHLFSTKSDLGPPPKPELGKCVKCRKEMYAEDRVSDCGAGVCDSVGHVKCMIYRKPSGAPFCAGCGSRWNEDLEKEYLNLASYMSEDGMGI
ncbi:hypothetical protein MKW92_011976 [Papaver armeniacum]|nr:hypothetical protein MKW92_011976 [Papaver armeniacum]